MNLRSDRPGGGWTRSVIENDPPQPGSTVGDESPDRCEEFLALFTRDRERVFAYIYSILPHHADAEDVFQRCSLLLWRKFAQFDPAGRFLPWACGIAFYEVCNFLRVSGRDRLRLDMDLVARLAERRMETIDRDEERLDALRACLEKLKDPERELIRRLYCGDGSVKEMAEASGRASQTLYNQLSRARRSLFRCVQRALAARGGLG